MPKQQRELEGFERKSIPDLDEAIVAYEAAKTAHREITLSLKAAKTDLTNAMKENSEDLDKNEEGALIYLFSDGETQKLACLAEEVDEKIKVTSLDN